MRAEIPGEVLLTGTSTLRIAGEFLVVDGLLFANGYSTSGAVIEFRNGSSNIANNCRLTNTAIIDYNPTSRSIGYKWVSIYGQNNRVDHCYLAGKDHLGTTLVVWLKSGGEKDNHHRIDHNYFGPRPPLGVNGGETIRIGTSTYSMESSRTVVEHNLFEHCNGETEIISNKSVNNIFRYNTFFESEGTLTLRHGNWATVHNNYFIGNGKNMTGGIRVIGEDHLIYNNYFENLRGTGFRGALVVMNGVPDSDLNRYFQVKRAQILHNTFVNCSETITLGAGSDSERTLPPDSCLIANNLVLDDVSSVIIEFEDQPTDLIWQGNIMYGNTLASSGESIDGITWLDPGLEQDTSGLWRLSAESPAIDAGTVAYNFIVDDMDGQLRDTNFDVGADEYSTEPVTLRPLTPGDVGPDWWPIEIPEKENIIVQAGHDSLRLAVEAAVAGDIIELVTDGGGYSNGGKLIINKPLTIIAAPGLSAKPIISNTNAISPIRAIFEIRDGGQLSIEGLELDGLAGTSSPADYLISTDDQPMVKKYRLKARDCDFHDVVGDAGGNFFYAYPGTLADSLVFVNCLFINSSAAGISLQDETVGSSKYNVEYFEVTNSTFWRTGKEAVAIYAGDDVLFTPGPKINIDHCTFDSCGIEADAIVKVQQSDLTVIQNTIFSNNSVSPATTVLYGMASSIAYSNLYNVGPVALEREATIGDGMLALDPRYLDPLNGDFTLAANSPLRSAASDGTAMGDLRWAGEPVGISAAQSSTPTQFGLLRGYPNPFNPAITLMFRLPMSGETSLTILDINGRLVAELHSGWLDAGSHSFKWGPVNEASGLYFYKLEQGGNNAVGRATYIK